MSYIFCTIVYDNPERRNLQCIVLTLDWKDISTVTG